MTGSGRFFAVIPAAGHSRRMGVSKLLLPLNGQTVIRRLLLALDHPQIVSRIVVVRQSDVELQRAASDAGGTVVCPDSDPPDMRASVAHALEVIQHRDAPTDDDVWVLIPGDHPVLDHHFVGELLTVWPPGSRRILIPTCHGRRGHPTLFAWTFAGQVADIPPESGLNWLVKHNAADVIEFPTTNLASVTDLDTPANYERLKSFFERDQSQSTNQQTPK